MGPGEESSEGEGELDMKFEQSLTETVCRLTGEVFGMACGDLVWLV
jgi:hypothetical protein